MFATGWELEKGPTYSQYMLKGSVWSHPNTPFLQLLIQRGPSPLALAFSGSNIPGTELGLPDDRLPEPRSHHCLCVAESHQTPLPTPVRLWGGLRFPGPSVTLSGAPPEPWFSPGAGSAPLPDPPPGTLAMSGGMFTFTAGGGGCSQHLVGGGQGRY